mgnify:CR=1 FL=1
MAPAASTNVPVRRSASSGSGTRTMGLSSWDVSRETLYSPCLGTDSGPASASTGSMDGPPACILEVELDGPGRLPTGGERSVGPLESIDPASPVFQFRAVSSSRSRGRTAPSEHINCGHRSELTQSVAYPSVDRSGPSAWHWPSFVRLSQAA